ncbi:hypothetical protein ALUC_60958A [Aspergillus luchuensis]|nr:hypothetical protein ALUC_60958A [Aspergillus luchuensis]
MDLTDILQALDRIEARPSVQQRRMGGVSVSATEVTMGVEEPEISASAVNARNKSKVMRLVYSDKETNPEEKMAHLEKDSIVWSSSIQRYRKGGANVKSNSK